MIGRLRSPLVTILAAGLVGAACTPETDSCPRCDTLVIAAVGEPDHLLPPFVWQSVGRDIGDLVFERLGGPGCLPLGAGLSRVRPGARPAVGTHRFPGVALPSPP